MAKEKLQGVQETVWATEDKDDCSMQESSSEDEKILWDRWGDNQKISLCASPKSGIRRYPWNRWADFFNLPWRGKLNSNSAKPKRFYTFWVRKTRIPFVRLNFQCPNLELKARVILLLRKLHMMLRYFSILHSLSLLLP